MVETVREPDPLGIDYDTFKSIPFKNISITFTGIAFLTGTDTIINRIKKADNSLVNPYP